MELVRLESFEERSGAATSVALGNFDGVHRGHQALVAAVKESPAESVVVTFDPHPARILSPTIAPRALMTLEQKAEALEGLGIDRLVVLPFTAALAGTAPADFARRVIAGALRASRVVVGEGFRFGKDRAGDVVALTDLGRSLGFEVRSVAPVFDEGAPISSSRIRGLLSSGDVRKAAELLGRDFYVDGPVVRGDGRGRSIGVPTANVAPRNETLPAEGVYACRVRVLGGGDAPRAAVANLGRRPTFGGVQATLEPHLLDFEGDLYGREVRVAFVERLRGERRFAGADELVAQIRADRDAARAILEKA